MSARQGYYVGHSWGDGSTWFATLAEALAFHARDRRCTTQPYGAEADGTTDGLTEDEREQIEAAL